MKQVTVSEFRAYCKTKGISGMPSVDASGFEMLIFRNLGPRKLSRILEGFTQYYPVLLSEAEGAEQVGIKFRLSFQDIDNEAITGGFFN